MHYANIHFFNETTLELMVNYRAIAPDLKFNVLLLSVTDDSLLYDLLDKELPTA